MAVSYTHLKTVEDIGRMLIQGHDADQLRLSDIARIEKDYEDPTRNELFYDCLLYTSRCV